MVDVSPVDKVRCYNGSYVMNTETGKVVRVVCEEPIVAYVSGGEYSDKWDAYVCKDHLVMYLGEAQEEVRLNREHLDKLTLLTGVEPSWQKANLERAEESLETIMSILGYKDND